MSGWIVLGILVAQLVGTVLGPMAYGSWVAGRRERSEIRR